MRRTSAGVLTLVLALGCADRSSVTHPVAQAASRAATAEEARYTVVKLTDSLGGRVRVGTSINNGGVVAGSATLEDSSRHAAIWRDGVVEDLGTLGGPRSHSSVQWPGLSNSGMVVGISHTSTLDPNNEEWSCAAFIAESPYTCVGFAYENGVMTALPTLGGPNGFATMANNQGQVVGWAETLVEDPTCDTTSTQKLQFRAVLWEPRKGTKQALRPLGNDSTSAATAINDRGQVVGISGDCGVAVGAQSAKHAVMWENGVPRRIPIPDSTAWNTPMDINALGDVVGFANRGDGRLFAFLWTGGDTIIDLGALGTDHNLVQAYGINNDRQIVGRSCRGSVCRAFLWENGQMKHLRPLFGAGFADSLAIARHINDEGQIVGDLIEAGTNRRLPYVATPIAAQSSGTTLRMRR